MKRENRPGIASLGMLTLFAAGILLILLSSAGVYRRLTARNDRSYRQATCAQYLTTRIRQAPSPGCVSLGQFGECEALVIRQQTEGSTYLTLVYCHEGWLMELYCADESGFSPEDGEKLLPLTSLDFSLEDGLLTAVLDGQTLLLNLKEGTP